jgi:hypothetical protein
MKDAGAVQNGGGDSSAIAPIPFFNFFFSIIPMKMTPFDAGLYGHLKSLF